MAVQTFQGVSIVADATELACRAKSFEGPVVVVEPLDTTALCTTAWREFIGGAKSAAFSAELMNDYDTAAPDVDRASWLDLGTVVPTTIRPAGLVEGSLAYGFSSMRGEYVQSATVNQLAMARISGTGTGPVFRGAVLAAPETARTATGNGTGVNIGALVGAQRMFVSLHVLAASGTTPSITVNLQSSATLGGTYTTRATFTAATTTGSQWTSYLGPQTQAFWRASWTISGTTPSFSILVAAGIATA